VRDRDRPTTVRVDRVVNHAQRRRAFPWADWHEAAAFLTNRSGARFRRGRGAEAVKEVVTSATTVDGFIWRKYGQKDINGRKHPRLYYRCAHRQQGCNATRRVQRTRDHPAAYEIAYYGEHTCRGAATGHPQGGAPPPAVVDFGSSSLGSADAASMSQGQQGGWSPPSVSASPSSEAGLELEGAHAHEWEWHDAATIDELIGAAPCYGSDPVTEFLDGCLGWEAVLNDPLDFAGLHRIATFQ